MKTGMNYDNAPFDVPISYLVTIFPGSKTKIKVRTNSSSSHHCSRIFRFSAVRIGRFLTVRSEPEWSWNWHNGTGHDKNNTVHLSYFSWNPFLELGCKYSLVCPNNSLIAFAVQSVNLSISLNWGSISVLSFLLVHKKIFLTEFRTRQKW